MKSISRLLAPSAALLLLAAVAAPVTPMPTNPVDLGKAGAFAILAKAGISTVPASVITGRVGISPAPASYLTGFALTMHASNRFATSSQVNGRIYASDFAPPVPAGLTQAVLDMEGAFTDAAGRAPDVTELGAGDIGGLTLAPGVYKWSTGLSIPTDVTLDGNSADVWILQVAQDLTIGNGVTVHLTGGATANNVFWQVTGLTSIGTTAAVRGTILCATAITLNTGASIQGRLLAQTAVDLDSSRVLGL